MDERIEVDDSGVIGKSIGSSFGVDEDDDGFEIGDADDNNDEGEGEENGEIAIEEEGELGGEFEEEEEEGEIHEPVEEEGEEDDVPEEEMYEGKEEDDIMHQTLIPKGEYDFAYQKKMGIELSSLPIQIFFFLEFSLFQFVGVFTFFSLFVKSYILIIPWWLLLIGLLAIIFFNICSYCQYKTGTHANMREISALFCCSGCMGFLFMIPVNIYFAFAQTYVYPWDMALHVISGVVLLFHFCANGIMIGWMLMGQSFGVVETGVRSVANRNN